MAHIISVKLKAFKSVGGSWVEVCFDHGLNAIVGPNGCGKSSLLDALCFAFAAPPSSFAAASLAELANSDSSEVCEVAVQLQTGSGAGRRVHTVHAALTPDAGRIFKVDGRSRSGREVHAFLRDLGVRLDSSAAVIKQAQVTRLSDSASPADLAAVVADASGLGRWNEEVAAAREELKRTRKALAEVQASLEAVEQSISAGEGQLAALQQLEHAEHEAGCLAQQMATLLQAALQACRAAAVGQVASREEAAHKVVAAQESAAQCRFALEEAQQQLHAAQPAAAGSSAAEQLSLLQQQVAAASEEMRLLAEQQQRHQWLLAQQQEHQAAVTRAEAACCQVAGELAACRQAQQSLEADLRLAESAGAQQALHSCLAAEEARLSAAVVEHEQLVAGTAAAAEAAASRLEELQAEQQRLAGVAADARTACCGADSDSCRLQAELQQQHARLQQLQRQEQSLAAEAGTLAARLDCCVGCSSSGGSGTAAWPPLHRCFSFKQPQQCQQYAQALQVLAGKRLGVIVADSTDAAGEALDAASANGARIWPLDGLVAADHLQQQRSAARSFMPGQVVVPADLLDYEQRFCPAILRAFGSHLIAANSTVAAELASRFGLSSITPDGSVTARGTLQGGWRGSSSGGGQLPMQLKLSLDATEHQLATVRQETGAKQAAMISAQQQLQQTQQLQEAAEAGAAEEASAAQEVAACQLQVHSLCAQRDGLQDALSRLQAGLAAKKQLLHTLHQQPAAASGGGSAQAARDALCAEQRRLSAARLALEAQATAAAADLAAAATKLVTVEDELALCHPDSAESLQRQLADKGSEMESAAAALAVKQADLAAQSAILAAHQAAVDAAAAELAAAERAGCDAQEAAAAQQAGAEAMEDEQQELAQQLAALVREVPELEAVLLAYAYSAGGTNGMFPTGTSQPASDLNGSIHRHAAAASELRKSADQLGRQRRRLLEEARRGGVARMPLNERLRLREQTADLMAARRQMEMLQTAAQRLQESIGASSAQVLATNEAVFSVIADTFCSLAAAVLPAYCLRLCKVGQQVHEGVQMEFASRDAGPSDGHTAVGALDNVTGGSGGWRSGLDVLSGGQRTMVSLALVVAASMSGSASRLLLMDEVDAALDESNQHLVTRLFDSLIGNTATACSQVLCVSHNAAFQQLCHRVVRMTSRGPGGTTVAGDTSSGASAAHSAGKDGSAGPTRGQIKKRARKL